MKEHAKYTKCEAAQLAVAGEFAQVEGCMARTEKSAQYPGIIRSYWYSVDWNVESIWKLDLAVENMSIGELVWHLDIPIWPDEAGTPYTTTPRQVLQAPTVHKREYNRIRTALLRYPLEVFWNRDRLMILDGVHRLAKAYSFGLAAVHVRIAPESAVHKL